MKEVGRGKGEGFAVQKNEAARSALPFPLLASPFPAQP
jgi:hypothetical protein